MTQLNKSTMPPFDDIPEAARDTPSMPPSAQAPKSRNWAWLAGTLGTAALAAGSFAAWYQTTQVMNAEFNEPFRGMVAGSDPVDDDADATLTARDRAVQLAPTSRTLLGHRAFDEAPEDDLVPLESNPEIRLRSTAAEQFEEMRQAAKRAGHTLIPLSGFRTQEEQEYLFFGIKAERGQNAETRAEVSAPPGYSEHHTGYAIDIGDATQPDTHLQEEFGETEAFEWLEENANSFGFELSFLPDNPQGVVFEPWHWRFVGDRESLETFYVE
jgi:D-alanyl-D-alanine carboxypeptidase